MRPVIIDVEASGFGRGSYPIEVGFVREDGSSQCTLIKRQAEWTHWQPDAEGLHGISRECLERNGRSVIDVATMLNEGLSKQTVYSDAWGNDRSWIALLFECAEMPQRFKLESLSSILSEEQKAIWHESKEMVIASSGFTRHRASNDALVLQQTYCKTLSLSAAFCAANH